MTETQIVTTSNKKIKIRDYGFGRVHGYRELVKDRLKFGKCECCHVFFVEKKLDVHHIDANRSNNNINNLMVVCRGCHIVLDRSRDLLASVIYC